jgi:hypothetical protein
VGGGSSPLSCGVFLPPPLSQALLLLITGRCCCSCQPPCLFTAHMGSGSSLLSCGVFLPPPLSHAFPLLVAEHTHPAPARASLACLACLFTVPQSSVLIAPHPLLACLNCSYCLLVSFSFFPCGGGSVQGAMLLWPRLVCGSTAVPRSSPGLRLPKPSGHRRLAARGPSWFLRLT